MTKRIRHIILILFFIWSAAEGYAQNKSNRGREFWLGYSFSSNFFAHAGLSDPVNQQEMVLYISTLQQPANVTVTINGTSWTQTVAIPANTADASINIPKTGINDARILTDGQSSRAIHVVSDVPVAVYAHEYDGMYSAATMLMPVETWGYTYYSVNYYQTKGLSNPPYTSANTSVNFPDWYNWFYAVAGEDNTRLLITPADTTKNGWLPGQTYTVNLNKGEIYTVFGKANFAAGWFSDTVNSSKDLSGSKIVSIAGADGNCHPVALFSGSGGQHISQRDGGEGMQQQVFPLQAWGTRYLTHHTLNNLTGDINATFKNHYRVNVKDPATVVKRNGTVLTGLIRNFFYEFVDSTGGDYIEADKPILVSQYTPNAAQGWKNLPTVQGLGDPEMFYISPIEQGQKAVTFYVSSFNLISRVYANVIIPTAGISSLLVDGIPLPASQIKPHPNYPGYSVAVPNFSTTMDMQHTITSDSAFTATVYGIGIYESYGYNMGCNINNLNSYPSFRNAFSPAGTADTATCTHTPIRFSIKTAYRLSGINWKLSQAGGGISPSADSLINSPVPSDSSYINGRKYYTYTLQQDFTFNVTGTYYLPVYYSSSEIDNCNNTENILLRVIITPGPLANFSISSQNCATDTIQFTGTSSSTGFNIVSYLWNFDDATTQTTSNASKRFNTAGIQNVRYRIFADNGCAGDTTKQVTVLPSPVSRLGATSPVCLRDSSFISDTSSTSNGTISSWKYFFEPLPVSTQIRNINTTFPHTYLSAGSFKVQLVTVGSNGCISDTAVKTVVVLPIAIAKFSYDKNICLGDSIKFTDNSSFASGTITSWKWLMGDGNTRIFSTNAPFYHKYNTTGSFTVSLIVTSGNGCLSDTFKLPVTVNNKPTATISGIGKACIDSNFIFTSSMPYSAANPANWYWNFGDGQIQNITTTNTASHSYSAALSNITVKHSVSFGPGCYSDTAFYTIPVINVNPAAVPFALSGNIVCEQSTIQFTAAPVTGITNWLWNFGNGTGAQLPPFNRIYNNAGNFNISLVVNNAGGCNSPVSTNTLTVLPVPVINAGTDRQISTGASVTIDATITTSPANISYTWTPATSLSNAAVLNPVATPSSTVTYTLKATDNTTNCFAVDSVKIIVISKLFIPNAFSPNGDGLNDTWNIPAMVLYPDATVTIFNRYGEIIYETKNYISNPWNGTYRGIQQPNGTYVYVIRFTADKYEKGTINIVR